jgi:hypothetical protein
METTQSTKFNVHDVDLGEFTLEAKTLPELYSSKSDGNKQRIEAFSVHDVLYGSDTNGLFAAIHHAYDKHLSLELHPDHFKLLILQGFSLHVNQNAEKFRDLFVSHKGKKKIEIFRNDFVKGSTLNPWSEVFGEFVDKVNNDLLDKDLVGLIQAPMTTTTPISAAAFNISFMETMQQYFDFRMYTMCGIHSIDLKGSVEDWSSLLTLVNHIEKYDLEWWTNQIRPVLEEIVKTVTDVNLRNREFWGNIIKKYGGSGGPFYDGWICKFFPYLGTREYYRNDFGEITSVPTGISSVPVTWEYFEEKIKLRFTAGFYGFSHNNGVLRPEISWVIHEDVEVKALTPLEKEILHNYKCGRYYYQSKLCYGKPGVNCDKCKKSIQADHPCLHENNCDLCMECVIEIRDGK